MYVAMVIKYPLMAQTRYQTLLSLTSIIITKINRLKFTFTLQFEPYFRFFCEQLPLGFRFTSSPGAPIGKIQVSSFT